MYQLQFTGPAEKDLNSAIRYISDVLKSPEAARELLSNMEHRLDLLKENPYCFPPVKDNYLSSRGIRSLTVKNYLVFYIVKENLKTISVIRILYARRNWISLLNNNSPSEK